MPFRRGRRSYARPIVNSIKNQPNEFSAAAIATNGFVLIAKGVNTPVSTVATDVSQGCIIKAVWLELWARASEEDAVGQTTGLDAFIWKNPGANLTAPDPGSVGTSNEKKFVFKSFKGLVGAGTQGFPAYSWRGWVRIPKIYQRMGTDDLLQFVFRFTGTAGLTCTNFIYKWYR